MYPFIAPDERYLGLLGIPGSNPLELFWDIVDKLDQKLDAKVALVEGALNQAGQRYDVLHKLIW